MRNLEMKHTVIASIESQAWSQINNQEEVQRLPKAQMTHVLDTIERCQRIRKNLRKLVKEEG